MATSAIEGVLWPGCQALAPEVSRNGGTTVLKTGYHGPRNWMRANHPGDYSIQLAADKEGPGDEGSALDWTFDDARLRSDFRTIAKFSKRLYDAGVNKDPRAYPLREFFGNIDTDRTVEGWSFYRDEARSSDSSHLWHIHFSVWRKYINDEAAMRSILSILKGESPVAKIIINGKEYDDIPSVSVGTINRARDRGVLSRHIWYLQRWLTKVVGPGPENGYWEPETQQGFNKWRESLGWTGEDAVGSVGETSLFKLAAKAGSTKPVTK